MHEEQGISEQLKDELARRLPQLLDSDQNIRQEALYEIRQLTVSDFDRGSKDLMVKTILPLLADDSPNVRLEAALVLRKCADERVARAMLKLLNDASPEVQELVTQYGFNLLGKLVLGDLIEMLNDTDVLRRRHAAAALGHLITERVLWSVPADRRDRYAFSLNDAEEAKAVDALRTALRDEDEGVQMEIHQALERLGYAG